MNFEWENNKDNIFQLLFKDDKDNKIKKYIMADIDLSNSFDPLSIYRDIKVSGGLRVTKGIIAGKSRKQIVNEKGNIKIEHFENKNNQQTYGDIISFNGENWTSISPKLFIDLKLKDLVLSKNTLNIMDVIKYRDNLFSVLRVTNSIEDDVNTININFSVPKNISRNYLKFGLHYINPTDNKGIYNFSLDVTNFNKRGDFRNHYNFSEFVESNNIGFFGLHTLVINEIDNWSCNDFCSICMRRIVQGADQEFSDFFNILGIVLYFDENSFNF